MPLATHREESMKVGLFITNQNFLDKDMVSALDEQFAMVRLARDRGWDSVFTGQHYLNEGNNQQLQAVPFLARLQAEAGHMTCGLGVLLVPIHNPVYIAETVATLDILCRGNFIFGVGLGYRAEEFDAFRVPMTQWGQDEAMPGGDSINQPLEELIQDRFIIGSPEDCYRQLEPYWKQAGVNHLIFRAHWAGMPLGSALQSMRMISDELLSALRTI
jgi:alkanesulfonate monooxygenase SsuD/methylene tetrahydromethanopterin reductase-like flavin-dependent oxidoreductase (luciferase family)